MEIAVAIGLILVGFFCLWFLFRSSGVKKEYLPEVKETDFVIEYYPLTGRYYVKYRNKGWLKKSYHSGVYRTEDYFPVVDYFKSEQQAREAIQFFKETNFKDNVKYIKVD